MRYKVLIEGQKLVVPQRLKELLHFGSFSLLTPVMPLCKMSRLVKLDVVLNTKLLPKDYKEQVSEMDVVERNK